MDGATLAVLVTSISGALLGAAGLHQARYRDMKAARSTASEVATKAADSAVGALNAALDRQQGEIEHLTRQVLELRRGLRRCEAEKDGLRREVRELVAAIETGRA